MPLPSMMRPSQPRQPAAPRPVGIFQSALGQLRPRYNRFMDQLKAGSVLLKVPLNVGLDEYNEVLGVGRTVIAFGASTAINITAPRDIILRKLILVDQLAPANKDWVVTSIAIEGNAAVLGGPAGGVMFDVLAFNPITFDLPVTGGTTVQVIVQNTAAAGNIAIGGGWTID